MGLGYVKNFIRNLKNAMKNPPVCCWSRGEYHCGISEEFGTLDGLRDVMLDALPLVDDLYEFIGPKSSGLQRFRAVVQQSARKLSDQPADFKKDLCTCSC